MNKKDIKVLLEAEEEASQLVEQLKALKEEIGSYKDAKDAISKTSSSLTKVSSKFGDAANGVYELIKVMREHGTTEIINKQQEIINHGDALDKRLKLIQEHVDTLASDSNVSEVKSEIATLLNEKHDVIALEITKIITSLETLTSKNRIYSLWSIALTSLVIFILSYLAYTSFTS